jgi:hypothetical protein
MRAALWLPRHYPRDPKPFSFFLSFFLSPAALALSFLFRES